MRILILTAIPFWHPGTGELIHHLRARGIEVTALDIFHGLAFDEQGEIIDLVPFKLKGILRRIYMKLFRQHFAKKHTRNADILDLHFVEAYYAKYIPQLNKKYICTIFGSDIFRTTHEQKAMQRELFKNSDGILLTEQMVSYFETYYESQPNKYIFNQYGSERIDLIDQEISQVDKKRLKLKFGIPPEKIVLTCGYNGIEQQRHLKMVEAITHLKASEKEKLFLLFPMTYGGSEEYHASVKEALENSKVSFKIFNKRLSDIEITHLRMVSDITLNIQSTDALSSSIKEAFVAENLLIVGDWLPYGAYDELGVFYIQTNLENLALKISQALEDVDSWREKVKGNRRIIVSFASWSTLIHRWIKHYKTLSNES